MNEKKGGVGGYEGCAYVGVHWVDEDHTSNSRFTENKEERG